jgi:hypothetical protein
MRAQRPSPRPVQQHPHGRPERNSAHVTIAARGARPKVSRARRPIAWGVTGFLIGASFWTAVSEVANHGSAIAAVNFALAKAHAATVDAKRPQRALQAMLIIHPANCSALVLDRALNSTVARPCPPGGLALRLERDGVRDDLANVAQPTLQAADYNLD